MQGLIYKYCEIHYNSCQILIKAAYVDMEVLIFYIGMHAHFGIARTSNIIENAKFFRSRKIRIHVNQ